MAWEAKEMPSFHSSAKRKHYKPIKHHHGTNDNTPPTQKKKTNCDRSKGRKDGKSFKSFRSLARTQALYHNHTMAYTKGPVKRSGGGGGGPADGWTRATTPSVRPPVRRRQKPTIQTTNPTPARRNKRINDEEKKKLYKQDPM